MAEALTPVEVFCCYSHADEKWLRRVETHLSLLQRQGLISVWNDRLIAPGVDWVKTIDAHLETASVILLLVSADFLASDYCYSVEMKRALERHAANEARVVPLLVRPVDWKGAPFAHLQALPFDARPLSTWQDKDAALANIVAGLRRVLEDLSLLTASVPRAALPAIWNIPYPRNSFFLGRESELALIREHLQADQATALSRPQAISGLGGIGKTQLALEYAYRYHREYQAVLWAHAEGIEALVSSYVALATLLHLPERNAKEQDITVRAVKTWLQTHRDWLLILDNADDLNLLPDFLPPVLGGHLLLTTRAAATGRLAHGLEIETLPPEQGALFLLRRSRLIAPDATLEQASLRERELALQISQELGGLPLALDQAGAYLEETGTNLTTYWQIYQQRRADLLQRRGGLVTDHPAPVATTMLLSFGRVEEKHPAAADLLRLCAFLSPDAIPEEILTEGASLLGPVLAPVVADAFLLNQAVGTLRAFSLVRRDQRGKTLSIHRMVQVVLQDAMDEAERQVWAVRAVLSINAAFPTVEHDVWSQCERLLPQALAAAQAIEQYQITVEEAERLLHQTALYLQDRARYAEAAPLYQRAQRFWEQCLEPNHPKTARSFTSLANLYREQGKYAEAEPLYRQALQIKEQMLGAMHPSTARILSNLALLYWEQGKHAEAEPLYRQALSIWEQQPGVTQPDIAHPLNNLALLYWKQGKYAEAESLYRRALQIEEQQLGPEHPAVTTSLSNLASLSREQGKYAEAESLYQQALNICKHALGTEHPETAEVIHDLALLWDAQGNSDEASIWYAHALAGYEKALGAHHPKTLETRKRLIALLNLMGQYEEAAKLEAAQAES
jgi:tetratricopeptide (TPR) repeat protein